MLGCGSIHERVKLKPPEDLMLNILLTFKSTRLKCNLSIIKCIYELCYKPLLLCLLKAYDIFYHMWFRHPIHLIILGFKQGKSILVIIFYLMFHKLFAMVIEF